MKKNLCLTKIVVITLIMLGLNSYAQNVLEFIPADLTPSDTGAYVRGVVDGEEIIDSCDGGAETVEYFFESGEYNGFTFNGCIIMPTCETKAVPQDGMHTGYVELYRAQFYGAGYDSVIFAEIVSPPIQNLTEINVEYSVDVTPSDINVNTAWIQYSKDDGVSWENDARLEWTAPDKDKDGEEETYNDSRSDDQFFPWQIIATASQTAPIRLRIVAAWPFEWPNPWTQQWYKFNLIRVFYWKITADPVGINPIPIANKPFYKIRDNVVFGVDGKITVYNVLGHNLGTKESFTLSTGVYIVKSPEGQTQKISIKEY